MMFRREGRSVAIDFRLTASQRELQLRSRKFAKEVLCPAIEAETRPTPEERFAATRPAYEAMIAAGFLRQCIPQPAGGENAGLIDTAIMAEELYAVNASVTLTLIGTVLGLLPLLIGGTEEQLSRLLPPFLKQTGAPLAGFCATEPGGSANAASPPPGEGVRTTARLSGDRWIIQGRKSWVSSATGWDRKGADILSVLCRTDIDAPPERGISVIVVERPASGLVFERAIDSLGHRAHLLPQFNLRGVSVSRDNVLGSLGGGLTLTAACFTGAAALVGIFAVALMRAAFEFTLGFARNERRGGIHPIIEHQAVGYALAGVPSCRCAIACRAGARDRSKSPWLGNGRAGADGTHAGRRGGELRSCSPVGAPAAGCAGASSLWWRQHRRPTSTTSHDPETAGIRSADDQWRGGGLTKAKLLC